MPSFPLSLSQWKYRKAFQITEQAGQNLTDYQVLLKIGESSGASGANFHLEGLSAIFPSGKNDGGDLRFHDGQNELSFWVEDVTGTSPNRIAYVWVKIPSLSANQTKTLYIYFGNQSASNVSNGNNTFDFFDDFDTNLDKWTIRSGIWTITTDGGNTVLQSPTVDDTQIVASAFSILNCRIKTRFRLVATSGNFFGVIARTADANNLYLEQYGPIANKHQIFKRVSGTWTELVYVSLTPNTNYHISEFLLYGSYLSANVDGGYFISTTDSTFSTAQTVGLRHGESTSYFYADWFFVSKYTSPEPAFSSAGSLEKRSSIIPLIFIR